MDAKVCSCVKIGNESCISCGGRKMEGLQKNTELNQDHWRAVRAMEIMVHFG